MNFIITLVKIFKESRSSFFHYNLSVILLILLFFFILITGKIYKNSDGIFVFSIIIIFFGISLFLIDYFKYVTKRNEIEEIEKPENL